MRIPGAEFQKKGTDSLTITSVMCMYTADIYKCVGSCGRGWCERAEFAIRKRRTKRKTF